MASGVSLIKPLGYQKNNKCGYCKSDNGSCSYYISSDNMRVDHYQELMDRGWRRSGSTYYKPDLAHSCCPHYTIRLKASDFRPKKEQRSAMNKWNNYVLGSEYKQKLATLCPQSRVDKREKRDKFDLTSAVHKSEYGKIQRPIGKQSQKPIEPAHKVEVSLEPDNFTKEKHEVLLKYQVQVHKDPESRWKAPAFKRFLCSGLDRKILKINGKTLKLGSYHQCYRLDGRLIAVGVLDLLPHAVSSVYLFYDPEFQDWDWGKLSALREITLAIEGGYEWYYMGYYIHSCIKMRYKATFEPTFVLDPEALAWDPLDEDFRKRLDKRNYVCISKERQIEANGDDLPKKEESSINHIVSSPHKAEEVTKETLEKKLNSGPNDVEVDSDPSDIDDTEIPEGSLFDYHVPGVLSKQEVSKLDLDHWKLFVRHELIDLEDLRGWEEWRIDDPTTIKGIAAELIAATGPKLLKNSALALF